MKSDNLEQIGEMADSIDNILAATDLPMPAEFHLRQIKPMLREWSERIKKIYEDESGENPWN